MAVGLVAIVIGLVLVLVPLVGQGSQTVVYSTSNTKTLPYYEAAVSGFSLTGTIPIAVSWTANTSAPVQVVAAACTASCNGNIDDLSDLTNQTGTSGSFTLDQPNGGSIIFGILTTTGGNDASVTFKVTSALSTVGTALVVVGVLLLVIGLVLRSPRSEAPDAPEAAAPLPSADMDPLAAPPE